MCSYWKKKSSYPKPAGQFQSNWMQIEFKFVKIKGQVLIYKGQISQKCKYRVGLFESSSFQEPLSQKSSDLPGIFLT
jgi:hypothetical protein